MNASGKPDYFDEFPCNGCGVGYFECFQGASRSLMCCKHCDHPDRWTDKGYSRVAELGKQLRP